MAGIPKWEYGSFVGAATNNCDEPHAGRMYPAPTVADNRLCHSDRVHGQGPMNNRERHASMEMVGARRASDVR